MSNDENSMKLSDRLRNLAAIMSGAGGTKRIDQAAWLHVLVLADQAEALESAAAASESKT